MSLTPEFDEKILRLCVNHVFEQIGPGLSEAVYQKALALSLRMEQLEVSEEVIIPIVYCEEVVGSIRADLIVNRNHVVELKVAAKLTDAHVLQTQAYLSRMEEGATGFLVNFGGEAAEVRKIDAPAVNRRLR